MIYFISTLLLASGNQSNADIELHSTDQSDTILQNVVRSPLECEKDPESSLTAPVPDENGECAQLDPTFINPSPAEEILRKNKPQEAGGQKGSGVHMTGDLDVDKEGKISAEIGVEKEF